MPIEIGQVEAIYRYPVKSMRGEPRDTATLGWHGLDGDRRLAFRRLDERGGFPWLTASELPELVLFTPRRREAANGEAPPSHVLTPEGEEMPALTPDEEHICPICTGSGVKDDGTRCDHCGGTGKVTVTGA